MHSQVYSLELQQRLYYTTTWTDTVGEDSTVITRQKSLRKSSKI